MEEDQILFLERVGAVCSAAQLNIGVSIKLNVGKKTQLQISGVETGDSRGQGGQS